MCLGVFQANRLFDFFADSACRSVFLSLCLIRMTRYRFLFGCCGVAFDNTQLTTGMNRSAVDALCYVTCFNFNKGYSALERNFYL